MIPTHRLVRVLYDYIVLPFSCCMGEVSESIPFFDSFKRYLRIVPGPTVTV